VAQLSSNAKDSWTELEQLAELAETPEDFELVQQLLLEREALAGTGGRVGHWCVMTLQEVADFFEMSLPSMWVWRSNGMPGEEGCWDIRDIVRWDRDKRKVSSGQQKSPELIQLEIEEKTIDVGKKKLAFRLQRNQLVDRAAAKAMIAQILNETRVLIEAIPGKIGPSIPPEIRTDLTHEWTQQLALILTKMAQKGEGEL
jgi:hypothetical protein